jgi:hypothetical protein
MHLGGVDDGPGSCAVSCDFFCSDNWRVETDSSGCEVWRYDVRQPGPGEGPSCQPLPDAEPPITTVPEAGPLEANAPVTCCVPDPMPAGCMHLGGAPLSGQCSETCDFFCSENWRIVKDSSGCDVWTYDTRSPKWGENSNCMPALDASID